MPFGWRCVVSGRIIDHIENEGQMIVRIWHGWTTPENADPYENLLMIEIFEGIHPRQIDSFRDIQLLRHDSADANVR
jgi:hypothetical protein